MRDQRIPALRASIALFVATCLFQLIFLERGASLYDEGSIISIGDSLSRGEILYRDINTFVAPFTYELMGVLYRLFGPHILAGRLFLVVAFALVVVFVHRMLLEVLSPRAAVLGAIAIWPIKPLGFPVWSILNYSQVALLFVVATMLAAVKWFSSRRTGWLVATGLLAGMAVVSKQDFGAHVSLAVGLAVVFDWWIRSPRKLPSLIRSWEPPPLSPGPPVSWLFRSLGVLAISGSLPIVVMLSYYAWYGAVGSLIRRTVFGPLLVPAQYGVPFPGFESWSQRAADLYMIVFAYFPAVFIEMAWAGKLNVFDRGALLPLELAIKTAYYLPMLAMVVVAAMALRRDKSLSAGQRSILVLIAGAAVLGYVLVYRADWIHLMNLYTVAILPVVVGLARWSQAGGSPRRAVAGAVLFAWLGFGAVASYEICVLFTAPIETARGRILDVPRKSAGIVRVLDYIKAEPASSRMLFMPHNPLLYFLSGRPILAPNDLVMPALIAGDDDDRRLAEAVEKADVVIYNPKIFPTAPAALYEYAPRTATVLSSLFDRERELTNSAVVLRKARDASPTVVADLWRGAGTESVEPLRPAIIWSDEEVAALPPVFRDHWMVYRVVALQVGEPGKERCFLRRHCVADDEWLNAMPITHPEGWALGAGVQVRFDLRARSGSEVRLLSSVVRNTKDGPERLHVSLSPFAGRCVELSFCATALDSGVPRGLAGWAEPQIVAGPTHATDSPQPDGAAAPGGV